MIMKKFLLAALLSVTTSISLWSMPAIAEEADDVVEITNYQELKDFATAVDEGNSYEGKTVLLKENIVVEEDSWNAIGAAAANTAFRGTFDGLGHSVTFNHTFSRYDGLFADNYGTIKNVIVKGKINVAASTTYVAALCAKNESTGVIDTCMNEAEMNMTGMYSASICGYNGGTVINCVNKGAISTTATSGGAVACAGKITNCLNLGQLSGKVSNLSYAGTVTNSYFLDTTTSSAAATRFYGVSKTAEELKDPAFAAVLGDAYKAVEDDFPALVFPSETLAPHEHSVVYTSAGIGSEKHIVTCADESCDYSVEEDCHFVNGICEFCGSVMNKKVNVSLALTNSQFIVPCGQKLDITWEFVNEEVDGQEVPKGWAMVINGTRPVKNSSGSYTWTDEAGYVKASSLAGMACLFTQGKPEELHLSVDAESVAAAPVETISLDMQPLTEEEREVRIAYIDMATGEEVGSYAGEDGKGYHVSQSYGITEIGVTTHPVLSNYVTMNMPGYRIYKGTLTELDRQTKILHVGKDGVVEKTVSFFVEVNHSVLSHLHVQPALFQCGEETILEAKLALESNWMGTVSGDETSIKLVISQEIKDALAKKGYELKDDQEYTVICNNYTHNPEVTTIEVKPLETNPLDPVDPADPADPSDPVNPTGPDVPEKSHVWGPAKVTTRASLTKDGLLTYTCTNKNCQATKTARIAKISPFKLNTVNFVYNGKVRTPGLIIQNTAGKKLVKGKDYKLTYASGRKNVGKYTLKVSFIGRYTGNKTLSFQILPKATSISSLKQTKTGFKAVWKKQTTQVSGYQLRYALKANMKNARFSLVSKNTKISKTIKQLKSGKKYYVGIRTYKTVKGKKFYSAWSKSKSVRIK